MKKNKSNRGILDNKKRFKFLEEEKRRWLERLSLKEAIRIEEKLLSSGFIRIWHKYSFKDKPVSLKIILKK